MIILQKIMSSKQDYDLWNPFSFWYSIVLLSIHFSKVEKDIFIIFFEQNKNF